MVQTLLVTHGRGIYLARHYWDAYVHVRVLPGYMHGAHEFVTHVVFVFVYVVDCA